MTARCIYSSDHHDHHTIIKTDTVPHLHLIWTIVLRLPVWDPTHSSLPIAKLLTKGSILGLGVATTVGIMESNVEKERPKELTREEYNQKLFI